MDISPRRLNAAMSAASRLISELPDDEQLRLDTIEGETDVMEILDAYVQEVVADEYLAEVARDRAKRLEARAERRRNIVCQMIEALEIRDPLQRPLYTASLAYRSKPMVLNADELPKDYVREAVDMIKLGKALHADVRVPGAALSNPAPVLTLRVR